MNVTPRLSSHTDSRPPADIRGSNSDRLGARGRATVEQTYSWDVIGRIVAMLIVGSLLVFAEASALAPFIYTIF
jgi:hypothetical protein